MLFEPKEQTPTGPPKFHHRPRPATSSSPYHLSHTDLPLFLPVRIPAEPHKLGYRLIGVLVGNLMLSLRFGHVGRDEGVCAVDLGCNLNACWIRGRGLGPSSHLLAGRIRADGCTGRSADYEERNASSQPPFSRCSTFAYGHRLQEPSIRPRAYAQKAGHTVSRQGVHRRKRRIYINRPHRSNRAN